MGNCLTALVLAMLSNSLAVMDRAVAKKQKNAQEYTIHTH